MPDNRIVDINVDQARRIVAATRWAENQQKTQGVDGGCNLSPAILPYWAVITASWRRTESDTSTINRYWYMLEERIPDITSDEGVTPPEYTWLTPENARGSSYAINAAEPLSQDTTVSGGWAEKAVPNGEYVLVVSKLDQYGKSILIFERPNQLLWLSGCSIDPEGPEISGNFNDIAFGNGFNLTVSTSSDYAATLDLHISGSEYITIDEPDDCSGLTISWDGFGCGLSGYAIGTSADTPPIAWEEVECREIVFANSQVAADEPGTVSFAIGTSDDARGADYGKILNVAASCWTLNAQGVSSVTRWTLDPTDTANEDYVACPSKYAVCTWDNLLNGAGGLVADPTNTHTVPTVTLPALLKSITKEPVTEAGGCTGGSGSFTIPLSVVLNDCSGTATINITANYECIDIPQVTSWDFVCTGANTGTLTPNYGTPITIKSFVSLS